LSHGFNKPWIFKGEPEKFLIWLAQYEQWARGQGYDHDQRRLRAAGYIHQDVHMALGWDDPSAFPSTWRSFKSTMKAHFVPGAAAHSVNMNKIQQRPTETIFAYRTRIEMAARAANREAPGVVTEGAQIEAFCAHLHDPATRAQMAHRLRKDRERVRHGKHSKMSTLVKTANVANSYQSAIVEAHDVGSAVAPTVEAPTAKTKSTAKLGTTPTCTVSAVTTTDSAVTETLSRMNAFLTRAEAAPTGTSTSLLPPTAFERGLKGDSSSPSSAKGVGFGAPATSFSAGSTPTKGLSPYLRCHNCGKNHLLKDCPDTHDDDKIAKNVEARRAARAARAAREAATAAASGADAAAATTDKSGK
jgi:hypothetical protein